MNAASMGVCVFVWVRECVADAHWSQIQSPIVNHESGARLALALVSHSLNGIDSPPAKIYFNRSRRSSFQRPAERRPLRRSICTWNISINHNRNTVLPIAWKWLPMLLWMIYSTRLDSGPSLISRLFLLDFFKCYDCYMFFWPFKWIFSSLFKFEFEFKSSMDKFVPVLMWLLADVVICVKTGDVFNCCRSETYLKFELFFNFRLVW